MFLSEESSHLQRALLQAPPAGHWHTISSHGSFCPKRIWGLEDMLTTHWLHDREQLLTLLPFVTHPSASCLVPWEAPLIDIPHGFPGPLASCWTQSTGGNSRRLEGRRGNRPKYSTPPHTHTSFLLPRQPQLQLGSPSSNQRFWKPLLPLP